MTTGATIQERVDNVDSAIDTMFLLVFGIFIYLMQAGFAFLEAGAVRSKNTVNILIKNALDSFFGGVSYWLVGYAFAYGEGNEFIGFSHFAHDGLTHTQYAHWFFQFVFAATAATIVSGAVAERCDFMAYIIYSSLVTGFIYPVVTHWTWTSEGWLNKGGDYIIDGVFVHVGYYDFAGSGIVHLLGGTVAFIGAYMIGPRIGRFDENGKPVDIRGHNIPYAALGGFILVFGFFAFNGSSQGSISKPGDEEAVAIAVVNTVAAASGGAFITLLLKRTNYFGGAKWSFLTTLNGSLTGMVSICAGCHVYRTYAGFFVGVCGGLMYMFLNWAVLKVKVDDPLDATAVHFGGGIVGVVAAPLLSFENGVFYKWSKGSVLFLGWQLAGLVSIFLWALGLSLIVFGSLKKAGILRVSEEYELKGLDLPKHGEAAYPAEAYGHGWGEYQNTTAVSGLAKNTIAPATTVIVVQDVPVDRPKTREAEHPEVTALNRQKKKHDLQQNGPVESLPGSSDLGAWP
ncbi:ammonium transmembrane transporter [Mactra antiquata]